MTRLLSYALLGWSLLILTAPESLAGGSGVNVVVVVNQNNTNSVQLGNYYCEKRQVPPQNLLRINWASDEIDWSRTEFETTLRDPLNNFLAANQLSNQVDYVVLSMGIPYVVTDFGGIDTAGINGTTSALFYGFKPDECISGCPAGLPSCNLPDGSTNSYVGSEAIFRQRPPVSPTSNAWLTVMITASNLAQAKAIVDRGVAADNAYPTQKFYLEKTYDLIRSVRADQSDDAVFDTRIRNYAAVQATNYSGITGLGTLAGFQTGLQSFNVPTNLFVPGAIADNLTSYSGSLFGAPDHTRVLDFVNAGATASYGTVVEPCAYTEKFATPRIFFYQSRGFSIAESYYQSLTNPYQGILVGEPLCAPFAQPCSGSWSGLPANALLAGSTNLTLGFSTPDITRPISQVDLFVDGKWAQMLTNITPSLGNRLFVTIPGKTNITYIVPANATLESVTAGMAALINTPANKALTSIEAYQHTDRLELRSTNLTRLGAQSVTAVNNSVGSALGITTRVYAAAGSFLDTVASGRRSFLVTGALVAGDTLTLAVTRTNGAISTVSVTNSASASLSDFAQTFLNAINANVVWQGVDGLIAEDLLAGTVGAGIPAVQFNLRARSWGIAAAQIRATLTGTFGISPAGSVALTENLPDLQPRNHLYFVAGVTNLSLTFPFDTLTNSDGYHELTAVAYEGSSVRTQRRTTSQVRIQNTSLAATLVPIFSATNVALEATLKFVLTANTNTISKLELFSTGGLVASSNNISSATFSIAATNLGVGLHPFYAVVTRTDGQQYRTQTIWHRILDQEPTFSITASGPSPTLIWPATAGRGYSVVSATGVTNSFGLRDSVVPTNAFGQWAETNRNAPERFYRVRTP